MIIKCKLQTGNHFIIQSESVRNNIGDRTGKKGRNQNTQSCCDRFIETIPADSDKNAK